MSMAKILRVGLPGLGFFIAYGIYQALRKRHRALVALLAVSVYEIFMAWGRY